MLLADWLPGMSDQPSTWSDICQVIIKKLYSPLYVPRGFSLKAEIYVPKQ